MTRQPQVKRGNFDQPACLHCSSHPALWLDDKLHAAVCPKCGAAASLERGVRVVTARKAGR